MKASGNIQPSGCLSCFELKAQQVWRVDERQAGLKCSVIKLSFSFDCSFGSHVPCYYPCKRMPDPSSASEEDGSADSKLLPPVLNALEGASSKPTADHAHADSSIQRRRYKLLVACLLLFTCLFSWSTYTAFIWRDPWEATRCRMAYMSPGYIRLDSLNESHSRLAGKYSLWLYREQGWDLSNKVCCLM